MYRILVHDYAGHAFQPQLSRRLAARGHRVLHLYSQSVLIPQGALTKGGGDAKSLDFSGIRLPCPIDKQAFVRRYFQERAYGRLLAREIQRFRPDVVLSSSTPLDSQVAAQKATRAAGGRFVFWLQDVQGIAIERLLGSRFNGVGRLIGRYYTGIEQRLLRASDAVVAITEDFCSVLDDWGVSGDAVHVIPNWASMEELPVRPKTNAWARAHGLADKFCFLYSGTIGFKHSPQLLVELALATRGRADVAVVVVSEGTKADWLKHEAARLGLSNLNVLPFQPYADVPDLMGAADVLVCILDPDAGKFSVPSKVLAYHCAGRPLLLSVPSENLAARIVKGAGSGLVVQPSETRRFLDAAEALRSSPELCETMSQNALAYARRTFNLDRITDRFESLFESLRSAEVAVGEELADERA